MLAVIGRTLFLCAASLIGICGQPDLISPAYLVYYEEISAGRPFSYDVNLRHSHGTLMDELLIHEYMIREPLYITFGGVAGRRVKRAAPKPGGQKRTGTSGSDRPSSRARLERAGSAPPGGALREDTPGRRRASGTRSQSMGQPERRRRREDSVRTDTKKRRIERRVAENKLRLDEVRRKEIDAFDAKMEKDLQRIEAKMKENESRAAKQKKIYDKRMQNGELTKDQCERRKIKVDEKLNTMKRLHKREIARAKEEWELRKDKFIADLKNRDHTSSVATGTDAQQKTKPSQDAYELNKMHEKAFYKDIKRIGSGGYAEVWKVQAKYKNGKEDILALKKMWKVNDKGTITSPRAVLNEVRTMQKMQKTIHGIKFIEAYQDANYCYIAMEYFEMGSMRDFLNKFRTRDGSFTIAKKDLARIFRFSCGLLLHQVEEMHNVARVVHRDIRPANMLMDDKGYFKLSDFGLATKPGVQRFNVTKRLLAPDMIAEKRYTFEDEFFCAGVALYHLLMRGYPFGMDGEDLDRAHEEYKANPAKVLGQAKAKLIDAGSSPECAQLIVDLLQLQPDKRLNKIDNIRRHPCFVAAKFPWKDMATKKMKSPFVGLIDYAREKARKAEAKAKAGQRRH